MPEPCRLRTQATAYVLPIRAISKERESIRKKRIKIRKRPACSVPLVSSRNITAVGCNAIHTRAIPLAYVIWVMSKRPSLPDILFARKAVVFPAMRQSTSHYIEQERGCQWITRQQRNVSTISYLPHCSVHNASILCRLCCTTVIGFQVERLAAFCLLDVRNLPVST